LDLVALLTDVVRTKNILDLSVVLFTQPLDLRLFLSFYLVSDLLLFHLEFCLNVDLVLRVLHSVSSGKTFLQSTVKLLLLAFLLVVQYAVDVVETSLVSFEQLFFIVFIEELILSNLENKFIVLRFDVAVIIDSKLNTYLG